jgi:diguanylate cyclase (GGDEF)-like protein
VLALVSPVLGLRNLLLCAFITLLCLIFTQHFQAAWQPFTPIIKQLPYWLFATIFVMAAQFNRSRLSLLSLFLIIFYAINQQRFLDVSFLNRFSDLLFLFGLVFISALSLVKDRALLSIHGFHRALLTLACFTIAWAWLWSSQLWIAPLLLPLLTNKLLAAQLIHIDVVVGLLILGQIINATLKPSTTNTALFLTSLIWMVHHYFPNFIASSMLFTLIGFFLLLAILTDFYWLAYRDELTGLPSRRALNQLALSLGSRYSVAMLDVDHFKKFNDTHGHDIGDQVLKLVATHIRKVKGGGKFFRYGGEEFTIVFSRKDSNEAIPYLDEVRRIIANYKMTLREDMRKAKDKRYRNRPEQNRAKTVSVTISIGVASKQPGQTFEQTIKAADEALYRAKEQGRNRVCE